MYKWVLAFHIIAVICWFAALFYLPRLFVYHAMSDDDISIERFKLMQRKLYRGIANPAMIATIILGLWLVSMAPEAYLNQTWFQLKAVLVLLLVGYHYMCLSHMKRLAEDRSNRSHVYFRLFNEVPVFFLIAIVILVIVQPF
ncbi:MAG: protoporphyrinogen oxidase HemJ [Porticoccaceae bacterium]|tara:strand:+ start:6994 stop:7419 length:426 start_codon:yes stop_codon:yes gene_type:complete